MRIRRAVALLVLGLDVAVAALAPDAARAQGLAPRLIDAGKVTCAELHALPQETRDRFLIYLDGYINGTRNNTIWDERVEGERIERAMADCKANPGTAVLDAFRRAWGR
jgi:hypothetical protein